jgi:CheY-like chemotaxis protein
MMTISARPLQILLIDDNEDFIFLLSSLIESMGHHCILSYDGVEGILKAKEMKPDVIFCDIGLPGMDGFEVVKRIRESPAGKDIFIIALSGYTGQRELAQAAESGFDLHMAKPIGMEKLMDILNQMNSD